MQGKNVSINEINIDSVMYQPEKDATDNLLCWFTDLLVLFQAIGSRNLLKSMSKQREAQQQQLQALIAEKKMQLERYVLIIAYQLK